jgi:hypothetical protein
MERGSIEPNDWNQMTGRQSLKGGIPVRAKQAVTRPLIQVEANCIKISTAVSNARKSDLSVKGRME